MADQETQNTIMNPSDSPLIRMATQSDPPPASWDESGYRALTLGDVVGYLSAWKPGDEFLVQPTLGGLTKPMPMKKGKGC